MKVYGYVYWDGSFERGTLFINEDGIIEEFSKSRNEDYDLKGTLIPTFVNAHTHTGDSVVHGEPPHDLMACVGPGGFKSRLLDSASGEEIVSAMNGAIKYMLMTGATHFVDFREGSVSGIKNLLKAIPEPAKPHIFGRPSTPSDIPEILKLAGGVSLSSISDYDAEFLRAVSMAVHSNDGRLAVHFSERIREDTEALLELKPHHVVHCIECTDEDLSVLNESRIPVVVTPRSNAHFFKYPDVRKMLDHGLKVALGTDNAMLSTPSIPSEMEYLYRMSLLRGTPVRPSEILRMATEVPRDIFGIEENKPGKKASYIVYSGVPDEYEITVKFIYQNILYLLEGVELWSPE